MLIRAHGNYRLFKDLGRSGGTAKKCVGFGVISQQPMRSRGQTGWDTNHGISGSGVGLHFWVVHVFFFLSISCIMGSSTRFSPIIWPAAFLPCLSLIYHHGQACVTSCWRNGFAYLINNGAWKSVALCVWTEGGNSECIWVWLERFLFGCGVHREGVLYPDWSDCCSKDIPIFYRIEQMGKNKSLISTYEGLVSLGP